MRIFIPTPIRRKYLMCINEQAYRSKSVRNRLEVCPVAVRIKKDPGVWSGIKENLEFCFFFFF